MYLKKKNKQLEKGDQIIKLKENLKKYANQLKDKKQQYQKLKDELKAIQAERAILERKEQILKNKKMICLNNNKNQKKHMGLFDIIVNDIQAQIYIKRPLIQEQLAEIKTIRQKYSDLEQEHKQKKQEFYRIMLGVENDQSSLLNEVKKLREEVYGLDRKIRLNKYNSDILELKIQRLNDEIDYQKGSKQLSSQYSSNAEMLQQKILKLEENIKHLKQQRELVKENYEPSLRQMNYFSDLKKILIGKLSSVQNDQGQKQHIQSGANRLVIS